MISQSFSGLTDQDSVSQYVRVLG